MAKNFNGAEANVIADKALLRQGIHILNTKYLEKEVFCFTEMIRDNEEMNEEAKTVSDLEKEVKIKRAFYKNMRDI